MKFKLYLLCILGCLATTTFGSVTITWNTLAGGEILLADGTTPAPSNYFAQLIWTPSETTSDLNPDNPLLPTGSEVVLYSQELNGFSLDGFILGPASNINIDDSFAGGYLYTRVFETNSPAIGDLYGQSSNFGGNANNAVDGSLTVTTANPTTGNTFNPVGIIVNQQIIAIPEPSTIVMLFMAFVGLVAYRKRK
ncbi:PEP-CTERM sorting domain-containing protein [Kiritimatiellota bacterium B12222]|nr:PEP-CTERM sorting domain-containing protein [Kiritimatiellota bacterium B12222]